MTTVTLDELQRDPMQYVKRVQAGETVLIVHADKPVAEMRPVGVTRNGQRPFGLCAGEFTVPEDFDDPLPDDILRDFEGG